MSHYKTLYKIENGRINEEEKKSKLSNLFSRSKLKVTPPKLKSSSLQSGFPENPFPSLAAAGAPPAPKTSVPTFRGPTQYAYNRKGSTGSIMPSNDIPPYAFHRKASTGAIHGPQGVGGLLPPPPQHRRPSLAPPTTQSAWVPQMPAGVGIAPAAPWVAARQQEHQQQFAHPSQPRMHPPRPLQVPQNMMPQQAMAQQPRTAHARANPPTPRTPKAFSTSTTPTFDNQHGYESAYLKLSMKSPRASEPVPAEYQNFVAFHSAVTPIESSFESLKDTTSPRSQYSEDYTLSPATPRTHFNDSSHKRNISSATFGDVTEASPAPASAPTRGARLGRAMRQAQPTVDSWATEDSWATDFDATSQRSSSSSSETSTLRESVHRHRSIKAQGLKERIQTHRGQLRKKKYSKYQLNDEEMDRVTAFKKKHLVEEQRPVATPPLVDDASDDPSSDDDSLVDGERDPAAHDEEEALLDEVDAFLDFYLNEAENESEKPVATAAVTEEDVSRQESLQRRKQALLRKITVIRTLSVKRTHKRQPSRQEQEWERTLRDLEDELCDLEQEREHYFDGYEQDRVEVRDQDAYIPPTSQLEAEVEEEYLAVRKASAGSVDDEPESYLFKGEETTIFRGSMAVNRQTMLPNRRATRSGRETIAFNAPIFQKV